MSHFRTQFANGHVVLPVIHVKNQQQAEANAHIAYEAEADGVFLINHETDGGHPLDYRALLGIHGRLTAVFPDWWIGVNCLDLTALETFSAVGNQVAGVWVDNAGIDEQRKAQPEAEQILTAQRRAGWNGLYFGGVAFKYQRSVVEVAMAAKLAMGYMDVVTTSGAGTGKEADVSKIRAMKTAVGDFPLAIASGITPENVAQYMPYVDCFLVATGISHSFYQFDPKRVKELVVRVRELAK
ncbi:MAG: BtpA/SgcQ family protein [Chloroflexota bacterium]